NTLFGGLLMHPGIGEVDFSRLCVAIGGGAAVLPTTSAKWKALTGLDIREGYGLSETSPILTLNPMTASGFSGTVGLPMPSTDIKLLDPDDRECAAGMPGEVCAKGPQVMKGYWQKPEANAAAFTADGYFRTGDIGVFDETGFLRIVDRKKDMIIVSGFNVYPNEVEAVAAACAGVAECACVGKPDAKTGEAVRLFVAKATGACLTEADVIAHCRRELAAYKVPKDVRFLDALPKSNVGKILRKDLRTLAEVTTMTTTDNAMTPHYSLATAPAFAGRDLGVSDWVAVDQDRIDQFAACTGDRQWIHVDVDRARRESPFGGPVGAGDPTTA